MKIVLLKSVDNLGQAGQAVEVRPGYFRNYLEPRGMALLATPQNLKLVDSKKKKLDALVAVELSDAKTIKERLDGIKLVYKLRAGDGGRLFGSVTAHDVLDAIKAQHNIELERRRVEMENLKTLGNHQVRVRVYPGVVASITVSIERQLTEAELEAAAAAAAKAAPAAAAEAEAAPAATEE